MQDKWETYRDLFEGDHVTLSTYRYLWPHQFELSQDIVGTDAVTKQPITAGQRIRSIRVQRSRYLNMTEPVVSNLISMALSKPLILDAKVETLLGEDGLKNIDGKGTSFESFVKGPVATAYFRDGRPFIAVDAPDNKAKNKDEEKKQGFRPFMELLDVLSVPDWSVQTTGPDVGKFKWLRHEYQALGERESPTDEPGMVTRCRVWFPGEIRDYRKGKGKDGKEGDWVSDGSIPMPGWTEIPVSTIWTNESWVKDVSELQLVLFNLMSGWYNQLNTQAYQRIFIAGNLGEKHQISISEYAVSQIPVEATVNVIEPSSTAAYENAINATADQIGKVAFNRARSLPAGSKEAPGAETIQEMNVELIAVLKEAIGEIETLVNSAIRHYAMFKLGPEKGAEFDGKVTIPRDIDQKHVSERLEIFLAYKDEVRKVLSWRKAELKRAVDEMGYDAEEVKDIVAEIEKLKAEPVLDPLAGLGPFMNSKPEGDGGQEGAKPADAGSPVAGEGG